MVPQTPRLECPFGAPLPAEQAIAETVEKRVEVVVFDDEHTAIGVLAVVTGDLIDDLQPQGRLAAPLFAEDHRRRGLFGAPIDFVPRWMIGAFETMPLEDLI